MWTKKILPTMLPARKWYKKKDDMKIGDICLLLYKGRVKDDYKLVKVLDTHPGQDGLIRTVTVGHRRKNVRDTKKVTEDPSKYCSLPMVEEKVHVQRLAVLQHLDPEHTTTKEAVGDDNACQPVVVDVADCQPVVGDDNACQPVLLTLPPGHPDAGDDNACQHVLLTSPPGHPEDGDDNTCLFA